jgi:hypothetical protein
MGSRFAAEGRRRSFGEKRDQAAVASLDDKPELRERYFSVRKF